MGNKVSSKQLRNKEFKTTKLLQDSEISADFEVNAEFLLQKNLISEMLDFLKKKFDASSLDTSQIFHTTNITENRNEADTHRASELLQMKLDLVAGFESPASLIEEFNHSELDKTFLVTEFDDLKSFKESQQNKFVCLILLLFKSLKANRPRNENFFQRAQKLLQPGTGQFSFGFESTIEITRLIIEDLSSLKPDLTQHLLKALQESLTSAEPGELAGITKTNLKLDPKFDALRDTFYSLFQDKAQPDQIREQALLLMYQMAVARASLEDLLRYCELVTTHPDANNFMTLPKADLLKLKKSSAGTFEASSAGNAQDQGEKQEESTENIAQSIYFLFEVSESEDQKIATDGTFLYLYLPKKGIFRLGSGRNNTLGGRIYAKNDEFKKGIDKSASSFFYLNGLLYLRNADTFPKPFICFDAQTLEERMYIHEEGSILKEKPKSTRKEQTFWSDGKHFFSLSPPMKFKVKGQEEQKGEGEGGQEEQKEQGGEQREEPKPRRMSMVSYIDSDLESVIGEEEEKCFEVIEYDPDTEDVLKIWELTDLDILQKFDELFPNFSECQCVLQNGVLYVRKGENLLIVDCEAGSEDGKYKGKLIHHNSDIKESFGFTYDPDRKAILAIRSYSDHFTILTWSSFQFQRGKKYVKPETKEDEKQGDEEDQKEAKLSLYAREEKRALKELSKAAATSDQSQEEASSEKDIKQLLGLHVTGTHVGLKKEKSLRGKQQPDTVKFFILSQLARKADENPFSPSIKNVLLNFKRPFVTQLNSHVFTRLSHNLSDGLKAIKNADASLRDMLNFANSLVLVESQILSLRECKLSINDLFTSEDDAKNFIDIFKEVSELPAVAGDEARVHSKHSDFMKKELEPLIIRLMSVSMELLYSDISDILSQLKSVLQRRVPASELTTNEQSQLCVIFDNLSHPDSIKKLLKGKRGKGKDKHGDLMSVVSLLLEFSLAGILEQIGRIKFSGGHLPERIALLLSEKKAALLLNQIQSQMLKEFGCVKNGEKRSSEVGELLLPYTRALVKSVNGLLETIATSFRNFYRDAKEDMMVGQIDQFEEKPLKLQVRRIWDLVTPVIDGQLSSHVLWVNLIFQALSTMSGLEPTERTQFAPLAVHFIKASSVFEEIHHEHEEKDEVVAQYTVQRKVFESKHPLVYEAETKEEVFLCENAKCLKLKIEGKPNPEEEEGDDKKDTFDIPPNTMEVSIKNEDFTFLEWKASKFEKNETETNCNVVTLAYSFTGSKEEVERKLKKKPYFGFKVQIEASYGDYKGPELLEKIVRDVNWFICSSAYELIKIERPQSSTTGKDGKKEEKPDDKSKGESTQDKDRQESQNTSLLLLSKLFSGGLEQRHFSSLGHEAGQKLKLFRDFSERQDDDIIEEADEELESGSPLGKAQEGGLGDLEDPMGGMDLDNLLSESEDSTVKALLYRGTNPGVEKVVAALQKDFQKKCAWGGVGGAEAEGLVRDAFAVMVKLSGGLLEEVNAMVSQLENSKCTNQEEELEAIKGKNKYEQVQQKWTAASRMRTWFAEKKKNIAEMLSQKGGSKTQGSEEQLIKQEKEELEKVIQRVKTKAELLLKLNRPRIWELSSSSSGQSGTGVGAKTSVMVRSNKSEARKEQQQTKETWKKQLHQWHYMQRSSGVIKSFEARQAEVFSSLTSSVLSCLQSNLGSRRIQKQIESSYVNAARRIAGMKMLAQVLSVSSLTNTTFLDGVAWFCASMRHNSNQISHYMEGIRGCGTGFEDKARQYFFTIVREVIARIKGQGRLKIEKDLQIKNLLDALKWQYIAADHNILSELNIFKEISRNAQNKRLQNAWGKRFRYDYSSHKKKSLTQEIFNTYEFLLTVCVSRALQTKEAGKITLRQKTLLPQLDRYQSVMDVSTTETLLTQAFTSIMTELERVRHELRDLTPLDWPAYQEHELKDVQQQQAKGYDESPASQGSGSSSSDGSGSDSGSGSGRGSGSDDGGSGSGGSSSEKEEQDDEQSENSSRISSASGTGTAEIKRKSSAASFKSIEAPKSEKGEEDEKKEEEGEKKEDGEKKDEEKKEEEKKEDEEKPEFTDYELPGEKKGAEKEKKDLKKLSIRNKKLREKMYSLEFLHKLLRTLSLLTGVATKQPTALGLLMQVVTSRGLSTLFALLLRVPPRHKILILRILRALSQVLSQTIFDQALKELHSQSVAALLKNLPKSFKEDELEETKSDLIEKEELLLLKKAEEKLFNKDSLFGDKGEKLPFFFRFLLAYCLDIRKAMNENKPNSDGIYCVSVEIISLLRHCLENRFKGEIDLTSLFHEFLQGELEQSETKAEKEDDDVWLMNDLLLGIAGSEHLALATGRQATLKDGHEVVVLGFADRWLTKENMQKWKAPHPPLVTLDMHSDQQKVLVMSANESRPISSEQVLEMQPAQLRVVDQVSFSALLDWILEPQIFHPLVKFLLRDPDHNENPSFADDKVAAKFRQRQAQFGRLLHKAVDLKRDKFEKLVSEPVMAQKLLKNLMPVASQPIPLSGLVTLEWVDQHLYNISKAACQSGASLQQQTSAASRLHFIDDQIFFQFFDANSSETAMIEIIPSLFANVKNAFPGKRSVALLTPDHSADEFEEKVAIISKDTLQLAQKEESGSLLKKAAGCDAYLAYGFTNLQDLKEYYKALDGMIAELKDATEQKKKKDQLISLYMKPLFVLTEKDFGLLTNPKENYKAPSIDLSSKTPKPDDLPDYIYELHLYAGFPLEAIAQLWEDNDASDVTFFMALNGLQDKDVKKLTEKYNKNKKGGQGKKEEKKEEQKGEKEAAGKEEVKSAAPGKPGLSEGDLPVQVEQEDPESPKKKKKEEVKSDPWRDFENNTELKQFIASSADKVENKSYKVDDELGETDDASKKKVGIKADYFANVVIEEDKAGTRNLIQLRDKAHQSLRIFVARRIASTLLKESPEALRTYIGASLGGVNEETVLTQVQHLLKLLGNEAVFQKAVQGRKELEGLIKKLIENLTQERKGEDDFPFERIIDKFLIDDTWALVKQMVTKGDEAQQSAGTASEAAALKVNKPEFILLILEKVVESKPELLLARPDRLKELLNLLLVIEVNLEEKEAFEMHAAFNSIIGKIASCDTNSLSTELKKAVLTLEVLETYSTAFTFDSESDSIQKPMQRIMFEILGTMNALEQKLRKSTSSADDDIHSLYYYSQEFLKLMNLRESLVQGFDFKYLIYRKFLKKLEEDGGKSDSLVTQKFETSHPLFDTFSTAHFTVPGAQQIELKFDQDCRLQEGAMLAVTRDLEGKQIEKCVLGSNKALNGLTVKVPSQSCYLQYPLRLHGVEFVGSHNSGNYDGMDSAVEGVRFDMTCSKPITRVLQAPRSSYLLTESGELWACGSGKHSLVRHASLKVAVRSNVRLFSANNSQALYVTGGDSPSFKGIDDYGNNYRVGKSSSSNIPDDITLPEEVSPADIVGLDTWNDGSFYWLENGDAYGIGYNNYGQLGLDSSTYTQETWKKLEMPTKLVVKKLRCMSQWTLILAADKDTDCKNKVLVSAGQRDQTSTQCTLGHKRPEADKFTRLTQPDDIQWTDIEGDYYNGYALDDDGYLYAWGQYSNHKLMDQNADNVEKPTKVDCLAPYFVLDVRSVDSYGVLRVKRRPGFLKKEEEKKKEEEEKKKKEEDEAKKKEEDEAKKKEGEGEKKEGEGEKKEQGEKKEEAEKKEEVEKKEEESEKKEEDSEKKEEDSEKKEEDSEKKEEEGEKKEEKEKTEEEKKKEQEQKKEEEDKKKKEEEEKKKQEEQEKKKAEDQKKKKIDEEEKGTVFFLFFGNKDSQSNLLTNDEKTEKEGKPFVRMTKFDGKEISSFSINNSNTALFAIRNQHENVKEAREAAAKHKITIASPDGKETETEVTGPTCFTVEDGKVSYYTQTQITPKLAYISKTPIPKLDTKKWPSLKEVEALCTGDALPEPEYYSVSLSQGENALTKLSGAKKLIKLKQPEFEKTSQYDLQPIIYVRSTHALSTEAQEKLPKLDLADYFPVASDFFGLKFSLKPSLEFSNYNDELIKQNQKEFDKLEKQYLKLTAAQHQEMLKVFDSYFQENTSTKISSLSEGIKVEKKWLNRKTIEKYSEEQLQRYSELVIELSKNILALLRYTNFQSKGQGGGGQSILDHYQKIKDQLPYTMKGEFIRNVRDNLTSQGGSSSMGIDRIGAKDQAAKGKVDHTGDWSIFGQIMRKIKEQKFKPLMVNQATDKCWSTRFIHEGGIDDTGLFRESLYEFSVELMSSALPLIVKTANNKNDCGENREKWTLNPSSTSPSHLDMYEFLGSMIGMSVRADHLLNIEMASPFWKNILQQPLDLNDLSAIDTLAVKSIENLKKMRDTGAGNEIEYLDYNFTTIVSSGQEVELKRGGADIIVTEENLDEYIELVTKIRLNEGLEQYEAIRRGINFIIPRYFLKLLSWKELEYKVCGRKEIETDALKAITTYSGGDASCSTAKYFWKAFEDFSYEERSLYVRFVWGRSRLPLPGESNEKHHVQFISSEGDKKLPIAHTCYFHIEMPRYSTVEIMKEKVLYAVKFCQAIDTDGSPYEPMDGDDSDDY